MSRAEMLKGLFQQLTGLAGWYKFIIISCKSNEIAKGQRYEIQAVLEIYIYGFLLHVDWCIPNVAHYFYAVCN
jgi:hypothetical protein